jgi:hypothetical protein
VQEVKERETERDCTEKKWEEEEEERQSNRKEEREGGRRPFVGAFGGPCAVHAFHHTMCHTDLYRREDL